MNMSSRGCWSSGCARVKLLLIVGYILVVADKPSASESSSDDFPEASYSPIRISKIRPTYEAVVLTGHRSVIDLYLKVIGELHSSWFCISITSGDPEIVTAGLIHSNTTQGQLCIRVRHGVGLRTQKDPNAPDPHYDFLVKVSLVGVQTGFSSLNMRIQPLSNFTSVSHWKEHNHHQQPQQQPVMRKYSVVVVNLVSIFQDVFFFILSSVEMLTLTLICLQLRPDVLLEVLRCPHALIASALLQALILPMVGARIALRMCD